MNCGFKYIIYLFILFWIMFFWRILFHFIRITFICLRFLNLTLPEIIIFKSIILNINSTLYSFEIILNWQTFLIRSIVSFITGSIFIFRHNYINNDTHKTQFSVILASFAFSILWIVWTKRNRIIILVGWDYLGLTSILLIIHYQRKYVYNYAILTFIINRIGDVGFIIAGAFIFYSGNWSHFTSLDNFETIFFLLSFAAFTKSALIPFSSWLPKAIAAPTPVSALVHSSTLVTAGVILIIQIYSTKINPLILTIIFTLAVITIFLRRCIGIINNDIKKIIAFSTIRQISFIIVILILGNIELAFFHLLTHAIFKSLIFLSAGRIIFHAGGEQDIRKLGNIKHSLPIESIIISLSLLALIGFPFLSGFYSKDVIIEFYRNQTMNIFLILILDLRIILTSVYSWRLIILILTNNYYKSPIFKWSFIYEETLTIILFILPLLIVGSLLNWLFFSRSLIESPTFIYKKIFGLWAICFSYIVLIINPSFPFINIIKIINSIFFLDFFLSIIGLLLTKLSKIYENFIEIIWIKFLSSEIIIKFLKNWKVKSKISFWNLINFRFICLLLLILVIYYLNSLKKA